MSSVEAKHIDGDLSVSRNVVAGGTLTAYGDALMKHNLKVEGRIDADNINAFNKGVFLTYGDLCAAYPTPKRGWCAGVGTSTPLALYMADGGEWVATGGHMDVYYSTGEGSGGQIVISGGLTDAQLQAINSISNKVDKVSGKSLSTNDYTNTEKAKVAAALTEHQSLANYATKSDLTSKVDKVAGMGLSSNNFSNSDKAKLDQALTAHQSLADYAKTSYVDTSISAAIGSIEKLEYVVVEALPETGQGGKIYLLKNESGTYDQYVWIGTEFAKIGGTEIDLSEYLKKTEISEWAKGSSKPSYTYAEIGSKPNTVAGYGITDVKIENGVVVIGNSSIKPLTEHQSLASYALKSEIPNISNKADKATTLSGYGIKDAKIEEGKVIIGEESIKPITSHQDISGKVDKVTGKGLSTNDYTSAEKTKLAGIAPNATANVGTVTSITAGEGLAGGVINDSGEISLDTPTNGQLGGIIPAIDYSEEVSVEYSSSQVLRGDYTLDTSDAGSIMLPIQVDSKGNGFIVIGDNVIQKLREILGI